MRNLKFFSACLLAAASLFIFSSCQKDLEGEDLLVGKWEITADEWFFESSVSDDLNEEYPSNESVGDILKFKNNKSGDWEGDEFNWSYSNNKLSITFTSNNDPFYQNGTLTKIDNDKIDIKFAETDPTMGTEYEVYHLERK